MLARHAAESVAGMGWNPQPSIDSLLAATALHHELRLVTRNVADFAYPGLDVVNPWQGERGERG